MKHMVQAAHTAMTSPAPHVARDLHESPNSAYTDPSERKWAGRLVCVQTLTLFLLTIRKAVREESMSTDKQSGLMTPFSSNYLNS